MNPYQMPGELDWFGCYPANSARDDVLFTPESTAHPAKMSVPLLKRILGQMLAWGWLKCGDVVCDPFGGRMTTGLVWCGMHPENRAVCIELEPHFVAMGEACQRHAERKLGRPLQLQILQGDSRRCDELLAEAGVGVTSAPYADSLLAKPSEGVKNGAAKGRKWTQVDDYGSSPGQIGALPDPLAAVTSSPYANSDTQPTALGNGRGTRANGDGAGRNKGDYYYPHAPGQIADCPDVPSAVTSAPYADSLASGNPEEKGGLFRDPRRRNDRTLTSSYQAGVTSAPYGNEKGGDTPTARGEGRRTRGQRPCEAAGKHHLSNGYSGVTSPPYEAQSGGSGEASRQSQPDPGVADRCGYKTDSNGKTAGQIGAMQGETYSDACLAVYSALARAGVRYICTVTKNPTRAPRGIKFCKCKDE